MTSMETRENQRADRAHRVAEAIHNSEMEGLHVSEATKADAGQYVAGNIDLTELEERVRSRYGIN